MHLHCICVAIASNVSINFWPPVAGAFEAFAFIIWSVVVILVKWSLMLLRAKVSLIMK